MDSPVDGSGHDGPGPHDPYSGAWDLTKWCLPLANLLQGKALTYFKELPPDDVTNYEKFKSLLLRRFAHTEEVFREKLRSSRPEPKEDVAAFAARISDYFDRWVDLAKIEKEYASLRDLMILEQMYASSSKELGAFLKERTPRTVKEAIDLSEKFRVAHPNKPIARTGTQNNEFVAFVSNGDFRQDARDRFRIPQRGGYQGRDNSVPGNGRGMLRDRRGQGPRGRGQAFSSYSGGYNRENSSNRGGEASSQARSKSEVFCHQCQGQNHFAKDCVIKACIYCHKKNHYSKFCQTKQVAAVSSGQTDEKRTETAAAAQVVSNRDMCTVIKPVSQCKVPHECGCGHVTLNSCQSGGQFNLYPGFVDDTQVTVLRDTGATVIGIHKDLIHDSQLTGDTVSCVQFSGTVEELPIAKVSIDTPFLKGEVKAVVGCFPSADLIVGNVPGVSSPSQGEVEDWIAIRGIDFTGAVQTRSQMRNQKKDRPLQSSIVELNVTPVQLGQMQREDSKLSQCFRNAESSSVRQYKDGSSAYFMEDGVLHRRYSKGTYELTQLVIPSKLIPTVLRLSHDVPMAGHMGVARTKERVMKNFFWPCLDRDVKLYCRSCDVCQKMLPKGRTPRAPLQEVPLVAKAFHKISIDMVGPILPASDRGNRFILTVVDSATRWPEAFPLRSTTTSAVAEKLLEAFSRWGIPNEILSDNGSNFTSEEMKQIYRELKIQPITTSPYSPQSNGKCERFNGTLKSMLKKVSREHPRDWDRYIPSVLFAYREVRNESTGFSPFEMVYGFCPRGPTDVLRDMVAGDSGESDIPVFEYVMNLRERLSESQEMAQEASKSAAIKAKSYRDKGAKMRKFEPGEKILLLLPTDNRKLLMQWKGPYLVLYATSEVDYAIDVKGSTKVFHVNMLQKYYERPDYLCCTIPVEQEVLLFSACTSVVTQMDDTSQDDEVVQEVQIELPALKQIQSYIDVNVNPDVSVSQKADIDKVLSSFQDVLSDLPGRTDAIEHSIILTSDKPVCQRPYPLPFRSKGIVEKEIKDMIALDVIEPSTSPYNSPIVLVSKPDGSVRFCIDFRRLNAITVTDAEPIPNQEDLIAAMSDSIWFTKIDLTKGYWEIPLSKESKQYTAFQTELGLFQFKVMPFGLVNAPMCFARLMRLVLKNVPCVVSFFDDIAIHTKTWKEHIVALERVLSLLRQYGLTAKPSKMSVAYREIIFLGHAVGGGLLKPDCEKVKKLEELRVPKTKRQVRSLVGALNYYRKFISNFSTLSSSVTDLTKNGQPDKVVWTTECQNALKKMVTALKSNPILILPDFSKTFILRTDASDSGIGACLLQERDGQLHPICFVSRKLLPRERNYPVIERECLAIVWSVQKLQRYLLWGRFHVESDHKPLMFLSRNKTVSQRLARWCLALQQFNFTIAAIPGNENHIADLLSRQHDCDS